MLNLIWTGFFVLAALSAIYQVVWLQQIEVMDKMMEAVFSMSKIGFDISIGLVGVMAFWLGIMRVGEAAGVIRFLSRLIAPFFTRLFPDVPREHPAMGAMVMNLAANMLGLDNAATPLGLKAMGELQSLNDDKETASNAQIMFLVINTSSVTLIPVTIFTYLYQLGYKNPTELFVPILLATSCSTLAGLIVVSIYQKINLFQPIVLLYLLCFYSLVALLMGYLLSVDSEQMQVISMAVSNAIILSLIVSFVALAAMRKVNVYEEFIQGAKEGFNVAVTIIPYLVAMLVAIGLFRASGAMDIFLGILEYIFVIIASGLDTVGIIDYNGGEMAFIEALPTGLMKPLSGSGARGLMIETIKANGVDSLVAKMVAVMQGSTETTFYVIAVYFGSVGIRKTRHAVVCGLIADSVGIVAAILICVTFFG